MSARISSQLPVDADNKVIQNGDLLGPILARTYDATISSATDLVLEAGTTSFEILAITQAVLVRFAATVSTTDFDAVVPANQTKVFKRGDGVTTISVIQAAATGAVAIIQR